jgi:hypothetical protein
VPELPPRYAFRLEDVRAWHLVEASCRRCRHRAPVDHQLLLRGRPLYTRLYDIVGETFFFFTIFEQKLLDDVLACIGPDAVFVGSQSRQG